MEDLLNLPKVSTSVTPEFIDQRTCRQWLALLPMINVPQAHSEMLAALHGFNQAQIPVLERLKAIESLRETIAYLQDAHAKRFLGRPLPFAPNEQAAWQASVDLWQAFTTSYKHCLKACLENDPSVQEFTALVNHRCLRYVGLAIREHALVYRVVPDRMWTELHKLYRLSERGHSLRAVKDSQNQQADASSCTAVYVQTLLLDTFKPSGSSVKQILWLDKLLDRWANYVTVHKEAIPVGSGLAIANLEGSGILHQVPDGPKDLRYLDTSQLAKSIGKRIKLLRMGESPAQLGLGDEFASDVCCALLVSCFQQWCKGGEERGYQRRPTAGQADVAMSLNAVHFFLSGTAFEQPQQPNEMKGQSLAAMQMFGHAGGHFGRSNTHEVSFPVERWDVFDQSALGFGLRRPLLEGERIAHNQLIGLRMEDSAGFAVAVVRWILQAADNHLQIGVRMLPGMPKPIAVRATGLSPTGNNLYVPALTLPAVAALRSEASLVLASGWFKPSRIVEIYVDERVRRLKFVQLIERGPDFERISFEWLT